MGSRCLFAVQLVKSRKHCEISVKVVKTCLSKLASAVLVQEIGPAGSNYPWVAPLRFECTRRALGFYSKSSVRLPSDIRQPVARVNLLHTFLKLHPWCYNPE